MLRTRNGARGAADAASLLADIVIDIAPGAAKGAASPRSDRPKAGADRYSTEAAE